MPTAQENKSEDGRTNDNVGIFRDEENPELEAAVFGMKPAHEIGLGFGHIKGKTVGLSKQSDQENESGERLHQTNQADES